MTTINTLNKTEARAACKKAGIVGYGNMTVAQMRDALSEKRYFPEAQTVAPVEPHSRPSEPAVVGGTGEPTVVASSVEEVSEQRTDDAPAEAAPAVEPTSAKPVKAPKAPAKPRDAKNGVTRPAADGKCGQVFAACDALKADGKEITFEALRAALAPEIADATIRTQRQRHKKYSA